MCDNLQQRWRDACIGGVPCAAKPVEATLMGLGQAQQYRSAMLLPQPPETGGHFGSWAPSTTWATWLY